MDKKAIIQVALTILILLILTLILLKVRKPDPEVVILPPEIQIEWKEKLVPIHTVEEIPIYIPKEIFIEGKTDTVYVALQGYAEFDTLFVLNIPFTDPVGIAHTELSLRDTVNIYVDEVGKLFIDKKSDLKLQAYRFTQPKKPSTLQSELRLGVRYSPSGFSPQIGVSTGKRFGISVDGTVDGVGLGLTWRF